MPKFQGFKPEDFKDNVADTKWRRKGQLGGALTTQLSTAMRCGIQVRANLPDA